jgi:hypothetical protein
MIKLKDFKINEGISDSVPVKTKFGTFTAQGVTLTAVEYLNLRRKFLELIKNAGSNKPSENSELRNYLNGPGNSESQSASTDLVELMNDILNDLKKYNPSMYTKIGGEQIKNSIKNVVSSV